MMIRPEVSAWIGFTFLAKTELFGRRFTAIAAFPASVTVPTVNAVVPAVHNITTIVEKAKINPQRPPRMFPRRTMITSNIRAARLHGESPAVAANVVVVETGAAATMRLHKEFGLPVSIYRTTNYYLLYRKKAN